MSDKDGMQRAATDLIAKALVWRQQARQPFTRAEANLIFAVDTYLTEVSHFAGRDVNGIFKSRP